MISYRNTSINRNAPAASYFADLGSSIVRSWRQCKLQMGAFPDIVTRILSENPPSDSISFWDCIEPAFTKVLPWQEDIEATFGQPPLTVYWQDEFRIDVLFWVEGVPGIHEHSFSGAFHVLQGESLHTEWNFTPSVNVLDTLRYGALSLSSAELLTKGDVRPIVPGSSFIHATYHLSRPTVSLVVRTNNEQRHLPQFAFLPPCIGFAHTLNRSAKRRIQLLQMLTQCVTPSLVLDIIGEIAEHGDPFTVIRCLTQISSWIRVNSVADSVVHAVSKHHAELGPVLAEVLSELDRRERIVTLRRKTDNPDVQFLLGLLLNIPARDLILQLIQVKYPQNSPVATVNRLVDQLYQTDVSHSAFPGLSLPSIKAAMISPSGGLLSDAVSRNWLLAPLFRGDTKGQHEVAKADRVSNAIG